MQYAGLIQGSYVIFIVAAFVRSRWRDRDASCSVGKSLCGSFSLPNLQKHTLGTRKHFYALIKHRSLIKLGSIRRVIAII